MHSLQAAPRNCPLCRASSGRTLFERDGWPVAACGNCRMVYLAREISYREQAEHYEFAESYERERDRRRRTSPLLHAISRLTRRLKPSMPERLLAQTLRWARRGKLLDIGCGDGAFLEVAAQLFDVAGVEISAAMAQRARARVPQAAILTGTLAEAALPEAAFDVVTLFSVLEHEWRPLEALSAVHRVLRPGAYAVIKVPNHASWNRVARGQEWCGYRLPDHANYFTPATLSAMLVKVGLRALRGSFFDRLPTSDTLWMAAEKP